jgi:SAM-dependent methyltransferase
MAIEEKLNEKQGHWILAKVGKKVLRPGGRELTNILLNNMEIGTNDDVVEFAPGLGFTAALACSKKPNSYTGVDNNRAASELAKKNVKYDKVKMVVADASNTTLPDGCASKVYGEAMLTMQPAAQKSAIIREAARILKPGGYYGSISRSYFGRHQRKCIQGFKLQYPCARSSVNCQRMESAPRRRGIRDRKSPYQCYGFIGTQARTAG